VAITERPSAAPLSDTGEIPRPYASPALQAALDRIDAEFSRTARLIVNSVDRGEGVYFWEIKSRYRPAVEAEVERLQQADGVVHSEFYRPWRENCGGVMWWRATGFTRVSAAWPGRRPGFRVTHPWPVAAE
jgi:hypothetical protein